MKHILNLLDIVLDFGDVKLIQAVFTMSGHVLSVNIQTILDSNFDQIVEEL